MPYIVKGRTVENAIEEVAHRILTIIGPDREDEPLKVRNLKSAQRHAVHLFAEHFRDVYCPHADTLVTSLPLAPPTDLPDRYRHKIGECDLCHDGIYAVPHYMIVGESGERLWTTARECDHQPGCPRAAGEDQ